jgi:hypothetical protein
MAAAAVAGGLVLAAGGATVYAASNPTPAVPAATPSAAPTAKAGAGHRGLLARTDHASLEVRQDGKWVTVDVDRGNVTSASTTSITLSRPDGQSVTLQISSSTKFRGKEATSASALKTGVRAMVISENGTATSITEGAKPLPAVH